MNNYIYIELLEQTVEQLVDNDVEPINDVSSYQFRWGVVDENIMIGLMEYGSLMQCVQWLESKKLPLVLVISGKHVVTHQVGFSEKEKRHLAKIAPYEIEDKIVGDVDELHFSINPTQPDLATVSYLNRQWFSKIWTGFADKGVYIDVCIADFQCLQKKDNETLFWFEGNSLKVHSSYGQGFSIHQKMAPLVLPKLLENYPLNNEDHRCIVYISGNELSEQLSDDINMVRTTDDAKQFFNKFLPEIQPTLFSEPAPLSINKSLATNFCRGEFVKKVSSAEHFKGFQYVALLLLLSVMTFLAVNGAEIYSLTKKNQLISQQIESQYRQVIPEGIVDDPVRQLADKLGVVESAGSEASQLVYLLSHLAPIIQSLNIDLSTINYSQKDKSLRVSIYAPAFSSVEQLRTQINAKGLFAELLSSNAIDDRFQARLRIRGEQNQ